jgi:hypothetical protein
MSIKLISAANAKTTAMISSPEDNIPDEIKNAILEAATEGFFETKLVVAGEEYEVKRMCAILTAFGYKASNNGNMVYIYWN